MTDNLTYEKVKEIVTNNPDITAEGFYEQLKQKGTDREFLTHLQVPSVQKGTMFQKITLYF